MPAARTAIGLSCGQRPNSGSLDLAHGEKTNGDLVEAAVQIVMSQIAARAWPISVEPRQPVEGAGSVRRPIGDGGMRGTEGAARDRLTAQTEVNGSGLTEGPTALAAPHREDCSQAMFSRDDGASVDRPIRQGPGRRDAGWLRTGVRAFGRAAGTAG